MENSTKLQRGGKTSGLTCLDNCLSNSDIDFPLLSSQFKDLNLQLHAGANVTNPYTFSIQGNASFSGVCIFNGPYDVVAYGNAPWYSDVWFNSGKVSDLTIIDGGVKFNAKYVRDMGRMFFNCNGLTSLDLSNFDARKVSNMNAAFYGCSGLISLDLSGFDTVNGNDMGYMFGNCNHLTSLDLSSFDTSSVTYMNNMFFNCSGLTSLDLSSFDTSSVTKMDAMFDGCTSLQTLDYSLTGYINNHVAPDLYRCTSLTTLRLHHGSPMYANDFMADAAVPYTCNVELVPE